MDSWKVVSPSPSLSQRRILAIDSVRQSTVLLISDDESLIRRFVTAASPYRLILARDQATISQAFADHTVDLVVIDVPARAADARALLTWVQAHTGAPALGLLDDRIDPRVYDRQLLDFERRTAMTADLIERINYRLTAYSRDNTALHLRVRDLDVFPQRKEIYREGIRIVLSRREWDVFAYLLSARGAYRTTEQIFDAVWGDESQGGDYIVRQIIYLLRATLGSTQSNQQYVCNQRVLGYYLVEVITLNAPDNPLTTSSPQPNVTLHDVYTLLQQAIEQLQSIDQNNLSARR